MQNYTPLDVSSVSGTPPAPPVPPASKKSFFSRSRIPLISGLVLFVGILAGYAVISSGIIFQNQAWETTQSATAKCNNEGTVDIDVTFTNTEPDQPWQAMDVKVKDVQTGVSADMGTIQGGGKSKSVTLKTGKSQLNAGKVEFSLEWTQEQRTDTETRLADYNAAGPCTTPTPTVTPSPTSTPTPTPIPQCGSACTSNAGCPASTSCSGGKCVLNQCLEAGATCTEDKCTYIAPTPTATPTPTACPLPEKVTNIKVTCPICKPAS